jgi:hypothetical protein
VEEGEWKESEKGRGARARPYFYLRLTSVRQACQMAVRMTGSLRPAVCVEGRCGMEA